MHKAGFVNIVGNPNVGKSTLMNQLVGEKLSIATFKAQTTRHRIMGIVNTDDTQIVFSDTPGVLKPNYKMQEMMLQFSESALADADTLLYVTDVVEDPEKNMEFLEKVRTMTIPVIVLINKIDELATTDAPKKGAPNPTQLLGALVEKWSKLLPNAEILPISAKNKFGIDMLMKRIRGLLPRAPLISIRTSSPTSPPSSSCRRLSARRSCAITTRKYPTRWRSLWNASRKTTPTYASTP